MNIDEIKIGDYLKLNFGLYEGGYGYFFKGALRVIALDRDALTLNVLLSNHHWYSCKNLVKPEATSKELISVNNNKKIKLNFKLN